MCLFCAYHFPYAKPSGRPPEYFIHAVSVVSDDCKHFEISFRQDVHILDLWNIRMLAWCVAEMVFNYR